MTLGEKLQLLRRQNGLSQEQLAEKLNVSRQAVSRWETGAVPDMENVIKISNYFDCSLDYLMNDAIDDISGNSPSAQKIDIKDKFRIKPETAFLIAAAIAFTAVLIIWIISKFTEVGIHHQDLSSGMWYTGFGGFVDNYSLQPFVMLCMIVWTISITGRIYIQAFVRQQNRNKKYTVCRAISWILYLAGTIIAAVCIFRPWTFAWTTDVYIEAIIYLLLITASSVVARHYERR